MCCAKNENQCLDFNRLKRLKDSETREMIKDLTGVSRHSDIVPFDKEKRKEIIKACKDTGMSIRQISKLSGVRLGAIR